LEKLLAEAIAIMVVRDVPPTCAPPKRTGLKPYVNREWKILDAIHRQIESDYE
jgi:hypothetical protein